MTWDMFSLEAAKPMWSYLTKEDVTEMNLYQPVHGLVGLPEAEQEEIRAEVKEALEEVAATARVQ